jgi:cell division protein FtsW
MNARRLDVVLLWAVLCLMGLGVVMVYSASSINAAARLGDPEYYLKRQVVFAFLGLGALWLGSRVPAPFWRRAALPILGLAFLALVVVLLPGVGRSGGGAQRWIGLGSFQVQPSEMCKFALVNFLAYSLARKADRIQSFKIGFLPHVLVAGTMALLLLAQPDFGTAVILVVITGLMMVLAGVRWRYLAASLVVAVPAAVALVASSPYRMKRILAFTDPFGQRQGVGYQVAESIISFGSGGVSGLGLGAGKQKLFFLPAAHTDFIFAIVGEELGLAGVVLVITLFATIAWRGLRAFRRQGTPDSAEAYLCAGITLLVVIQAATNMAVVLGLVPTKGLTLPFVSYGGSSLVAFCFMSGVLLRLCGQAQEPMAERMSVPRVAAVAGVRA